MPFGVSVWEVLLLLLVALLIFGPKRLPEMGRSLGKGMREFKESISGRGDDADDPPELDAADDDRTVRPTPREHDAVR